MKVVVMEFRNRIRQQVNINDMRYAFMPDKGSTDAIFVVRPNRTELDQIGYNCFQVQVHEFLGDLR